MPNSAIDSWVSSGVSSSPHRYRGPAAAKLRVGRLRSGAAPGDDERLALAAALARHLAEHLVDWLAHQRLGVVGQHDERTGRGVEQFGQLVRVRARAR